MVDIPLVGNRFAQTMLILSRYDRGSLFLRLSYWFIVVVVDTLYWNHDILDSQNYKGEVK